MGANDAYYACGIAGGGIVVTLIANYYTGFLSGFLPFLPVKPEIAAKLIAGSRATVRELEKLERKSGNPRRAGETLREQMKREDAEETERQWKAEQAAEKRAQEDAARTGRSWY